MNMNALIRYDVPPEIIKLWRQRESDALLPLQELAIKQYGLFDGGNLLIQAPTSSGKTFIGEMAAVRTALRRKKVVYLVPLKALAEEKYLDFREKYGPYGLRVIVSSRDHREFDRDLEEGAFSIAVVVYEKLSQLLVRRPERLEEIELVIADELELLSDPDRGAMVELLLTRILEGGRERQVSHAAAPACRLIGLSAVIGRAQKLADWLDARLVFFERRPVELRYGVLHDGVFRYRTHNDYTEGREPLESVESDSTWEILTQNVCAFAARGEACLIFVKAKHESRRGAELLAGRVNLPAAADALAALRKLEPTRSRDALLETLANGVAFHNADLSPKERRVVEEAFRRGEVNVIVSTSTLAQGMNLPAHNVFITADKWRYDRRFGMPWKTPILRTEYENMGGRAGRYGSGHEFGRSILIAATPFDCETFWRRYVEGESEPVEPRLDKTPLDEHVLHLIASRFCSTEDALRRFLENTLTGQWIWRETLSPEEIAFHVHAAVNRVLDAGAIAAGPDGRLEATPFGQAVAAKGIAIATARELVHWIGESETRLWSDIDLILAAAMTPDGRMPNVSLTAREYEQADYPGVMKRLTDDEPIAPDVPLNRLRNCPLTPFFEEVRAIKVALFLDEWTNQAALCDIEERFDTLTGQVLAAADQVAWLIDAAGAVAAALGAKPPFVDRVKTLSARVQHGLREHTVPLAQAPGLNLARPAILKLDAFGLASPEAIAGASLDTLARHVSRRDARALKTWADRALDAKPGRVDTSPPPPADPVLVVDDKRPGAITLEGASVKLQEKQYRLIRTLAARPGECVPYDTIYTAVWGDVIVEPNQMHFQKRKLLDRIARIAPHHGKLITTVPKRGFVLNLEPEAVMLEPKDASAAASCVS